MLARALIVLLLILNLGVALWWVGREPPPPESAPQHAAGVELLELLTAPVADATAAPPPAPTPVATVVPADPQPAPPPSAPAPGAAQSAAVCRSLGPFDAAGAARAEAQLRPRVRTLSVRQTQGETGRGWRVLMRGQPGREAASATAARLAAAGFRDYYLMPVADDGTVAIALGRYSSESAARRHQQALATAGFPAVAEPLGEPGATRYWLDVAVGAEAELAGLQRASGAARSEARACGSLAAR